jgi:hypothetical protein
MIRFRRQNLPPPPPPKDLPTVTLLGWAAVIVLVLIIGVYAVHDVYERNHNRAQEDFDSISLAL